MNPVITALDNVTVFTVTGQDASAFLQGQLSQDVDILQSGHALLAGWHDPKGRVRCLIRLIATNDGYLASTSKSLADGIISSLQRYVLRADVQFTTDERMRAVGICPGPKNNTTNNDATDLEKPIFTPFSNLPKQIGEAASTPDYSCVAIAPEVWHLYTRNDELIAETRNESDSILTRENFNLHEINAGIPIVDSTSTGKYVAQMLNLDLLNALSFKKGCYPGQEIIARAEHIGSVKRRLTGFSAKTTMLPAAGTSIVDTQGTEVGVVNRATISADNTCRLLGVTRIDIRDNQLHLDTIDGAQLTRFQLPYE